jgi:hypothetical protein
MADAAEQTARRAVREAQTKFEREQTATQKARRKAFADAQKAGLSLRDIGDEVDLHRSRVAQIIAGNSTVEVFSTPLLISLKRENGDPPRGSASGPPDHKEAVLLMADRNPTDCGEFAPTDYAAEEMQAQRVVLAFLRRTSIPAHDPRAVPGAVCAPERLQKQRCGRAGNPRAG